MGKWMLKTKEKYRALSAVQKLMGLTTIVMLSFSVTSILHWGWLATVIGFVSIVLLVILTLAFLAEKMKDNPPLPLTDLRKVESVTEINRPELNKHYKNDTGKYMPIFLYLSTPDERAYIEWLELQVTKYLELQSITIIEDSIIEGMAHEDKDMEDY